MELQLFGKCELIDKLGRVKVHYHERNDPSYRKLTYHVEQLKLTGQSPMRHDGFLVDISGAKLFAPELTDDPNRLLGCNLSILCKIKKYKYTKLGEVINGWKLYARVLSCV